MRRSGEVSPLTALETMPERIVAIGLLTSPELNALGKAFDRAWPIEKATSAFDDLLRAVDEADRGLQVPTLDATQLD